MPEYLTTQVSPDWEAFVRCIKREGTPKRVHHIELFLDGEVKQAIWDRYGLGADMDPNAPDYWFRREAEIQRFLGYDYVRCAYDGLVWPFNREVTEDTADLQRSGGRTYINEHAGPITTWEEFETYPWPDPEKAETRALEWCQKNLPDGMCVVAGGGFAHFAEHLTWLMGYESLCLALYDQRDLVAAIARRLEDVYRVALGHVLEFSCVKAVWGSDDMGFRGGTLISPDDCRAFFLPGHREMARMAHAKGLPYLLHSCGNLSTIMDDLIDDVGIDAKHSFEDTIEDVRQVKHTYGTRIGLLGGIDVDFLCQATEEQVRQRVRETLDACMPGGGYCLGTGNSVANYIPLDNYLAMVDEGRKWVG